MHPSLAARLAAGALLAALAFPEDDPPEVPRDELPVDFGAAVPLGLPADSAAARAPSTAEVALGRRLFFDPVLSIDGSVACASCHDPAKGFADDRALSRGVNGEQTLRNAPTLYNRGLGAHFMWDGRARTLVEQVLLPISDPREMGLSLSEAVERLARHGEYPALFEAACGGAPSAETLARALAAFVSRILYADSAVDRFRAGDFEALSPEERSGLWFYESRGRCWKCHPGPLFTDEGFHATGVGAQDGVPLEGRFAITADEADRGRFKTPTLRGVAETAPYMHDGSLATLEQVVEFYRKGGIPNARLDPELAPLEMSDEDARHLVAFLNALSRR